MKPISTWRGRALALAASLAGFWLVALAVDRRTAEASGQPLEGSERDEVLATLDRFQRIYTDFLVSGGAPALIDEFPATKAVKHRVFREIGFVRGAGLVQVVDLADATPLRVERFPDGRVEATCYEEWNHVVQREEGRAPASRLMGMGGGFRYRLKREAGRWIVTAWDPVDVEPPDRPAGRRY